jgi:SAM-dependent methyltransferase
MSKHDILTEKEFSEYVPNKRVLYYLTDYSKTSGLKNSEINVLDWGCGRGKDVLWLREEGYNAFGVDIDPEPIQNGMNLFYMKGYNESVLNLIDHTAKTQFPDSFFHFIFSNQVFEHISDLELVATEFRRITAKGGVGYHVYPAHRYITERHLCMPFVHWLPKNRLRKYLIFAYVGLGQEPNWNELSDYNIVRKTETYFKYSVNKTYYRKYYNVKRLFEDKSFKVTFETINHPILKQYRLVYWLANTNLCRSLVNHLLLTFKMVELLVGKL